MVICFNGIDGSGKSYQAQRLVARLNAAGYPAVYVWNGMRAPLTRALTRGAKRLLQITRVSDPATVGANAAGATYRSYLAQTEQILGRPALRALWLHKSLAEHTAEIWSRVLPSLLHQRVVVCDRYLYDTALSVGVLGNLGPHAATGLLRQALLYPVPRPTLWFFLDVPAEVGYGRKHDVPDLLFLQRRVPLYHAAARQLGMRWLDGTAAPDEIAATVWHAVSTALPRTPARALDRG